MKESTGLSVNAGVSANMAASVTWPMDSASAGMDI